MRPFLVAALLFAAAASARADEKVKALFRKCAPATVYVENKPNEDGSTTVGSGSIIDPAGVVLTNHHVIAPALERDKEVNIYLFDGRKFTGTVIASTDKLDLALISLQDSPGGLPVLEWGDSEAIEVGEDVIAIGNPDGLKWTLSTGIVSGKREDMLQTTAPINPGNSGGPLIGPDGRQYGVNTLSAYKERNNIAFSRTSNVARKWIEQVSSGEPERLVTTRWTDPEFGFSVTPPAGWRPLEDSDKVQFQRFAWQGDDSVLRVYRIPGDGKAGIRKHSVDQETVLKRDFKTYKRLTLDFLTFRGKEDAYSLTYRFAWKKDTLVSYQVTVNDGGDIWTLRFTCPEASHSVLQKKFDETIQNARWSTGNAGRETPEQTLQTWVQSIRNGDTDAFIACIAVPEWLNHTTEGAWGKATPAQKKEMESRWRQNVKDMMAKGDLAKQVERGVRIMSATVDGENATVGLISVTDDGQTVIEDTTLMLRDGSWLITGFGQARAYEEKNTPGPGKEPKRKKFRDDSKSFTVDYPGSWSVGSASYENNVVVHTFSEKDAAGNPTTHTIIATGDVRSQLTQDTLTDEELDTMTESVLTGAKGTFKAKFKVRSKTKSKLGGLEALKVVYVGQASKFDPEFETTLWVTYRNGWLYTASVIHKAGEDISEDYQKIVDSFKATGKRK